MTDVFTDALRRLDVEDDAVGPELIDRGAAEDRMRGLLELHDDLRAALPECLAGIEIEAPDDVRVILVARREDPVALYREAGGAGYAGDTAENLRFLQSNLRFSSK